MGLFDLFKKKKEQPSKSNLSLEMLLQKSAAEPAYQPEFYKRLLSDDLVVITESSAPPRGKHILQEDTKVNIVSYQDGKIPVFTSKERIFDKGVIKEQVQYLQMKGQDLFETAKGATFLLNPYSDYGKELLPDEVQSMLNGTILTDQHRQVKIEKDTKVMLAQPAKYPTAIVNALKILFSKYPNINAAYLGWIFNPESGEPPHYIFAIEGEGDLQSITHEAGFIAKQFLDPAEIVDFIRIDNKGGLCDYFTKETTAFYRR